MKKTVPAETEQQPQREEQAKDHVTISNSIYNNVSGGDSSNGSNHTYDRGDANVERHHDATNVQSPDESQALFAVQGKNSREKRPNYIVYGLVILFGLSSWIVVNGLYTCLPLFMLRLPEKYEIAADMNFALQLANVFPFALFLLACVTPWRRLRYHLDSAIIIVMLVVGVIACVLLAFLWDRVTVWPSGQKRSVAFLVLVFIVGAVDCTSSVVYWPFISHYTSYYTTALSIGEGSTALVAGLMGLVMQPGESPLFPFYVFALLLALLMVLSGVAFVLLRFLPYCKREMVSDQATLLEKSSGTGGDQVVKSSPSLEPVNVRSKVLSSTRLITVQFLLSFVQNGILVAIGPYMFHSYPKSVALLRYSILVAQILDPFCCLLAYFLESVYKWYVALSLHLLWIGLSIFQFVVALMNPHSPASGSMVMGVGLAVMSVVGRMLISFVKTSEWLLMHKTTSQWKVAGEQTARIESETNDAEPVEPVKKRIMSRVELSPFRIAGLGIQIGALLGSVIIIVLTQRHILQ